MSSYEVHYENNRYVDICDPSSTIKLYRILFSLLESKHSNIPTPESEHIVYLLSGKDNTGRDCLYVGKSSNGIKNRPTSHEDKNVPWKYCYILTSTNANLLNGSRAQYLEDCLKRLIDQSDYDNKTINTSGKEANLKDKEVCDKILPKILESLDILGIDIKTGQDSIIAEAPVKMLIRESDEGIDYSEFDLPQEMIDWLKKIKDIMESLDSGIATNIKTNSNYVSFRFSKKTLVYCYPRKSEKFIRVFFYGTPDWYSDPRVTQRPEKYHNRPCDSVFYIRDAKDIESFRTFAETLIRRFMESR